MVKGIRCQTSHTFAPISAQGIHFMSGEPFQAAASGQHFTEIAASRSPERQNGTRPIKYMGKARRNENGGIVNDFYNGAFEMVRPSPRSHPWRIKRPAGGDGGRAGSGGTARGKGTHTRNPMGVYEFEPN